MAAAIARIAAALAHAPVARLYRETSNELRLAGAFAAPPDEAGADAATLAVAREAIRSGRPVAVPVRARAVTEGVGDGRSHLAVPLGTRGEAWVGALVVSAVGERRWTTDEVCGLADLCALSRSSLRSPAPATHARIGRASNGGGAPAGWRSRIEAPAAARPRPETGTPRPAELFCADGELGLVEIIRQSIVASLHLGTLRAGDRLPSIRRTARAFAVTPYMVLQAYAELEVEGLVERRERSGIFVAPFEVASSRALPETGEWLSEVLTQACLHQVKIPLLPDLIRRWTSSVRVRCACLESCHDSRHALAMDLSQQFGIQTLSAPVDTDPELLSDVDLVVTTAYHAAEVTPLAADAAKPLLIATVNPLLLSSALNHLRTKDLTVICVDPAYGDRLRALHGGAYRDRVHVVTVGDRASLASLDRSEAVLLTPAARERLRRSDFRLIAPLHPSFSLEFARRVAEALVRINLQAARA